MGVLGWAAHNSDRCFTRGTPLERCCFESSLYSSCALQTSRVRGVCITACCNLQITTRPVVCFGNCLSWCQGSDDWVGVHAVHYLHVNRLHTSSSHLAAAYSGSNITFVWVHVLVPRATWGSNLWSHTTQSTVVLVCMLSQSKVGCSIMLRTCMMLLRLYGQVGSSNRFLRCSQQPYV